MIKICGFFLNFKKKNILFFYLNKNNIICEDMGIR